VPALYVGVMSGTSLDGVDAVVTDFSGAPPRTLAFATLDYPDALRERLMALSHEGSDSLEAAGRASLELADLYAQVVQDALRKAGVAPKDVRAIGVHGQTVRHRPDPGFTLQLNDPARVAERCGIDVVADFRRRDMAAGGQGAPLVPAFHEAVFGDPRRSRAIVNIGGIANVTWLAPGRPTVGFDCGPGNVLMDAWVQRHLGARFDQDGRWAASGHADEAFLARLLGEPYLGLPPPKSTGRELFGEDWLEPRLPKSARAEDVQATLADFTARTIVDAIDRACPGTAEIYLAGGGARNAHLVSRLRALAGGRPVEPTDTLGVPTQHVEAVAFAWLAMKCVAREPIDMTAITGAKGPRILGAVYPA
jgi:anhydro-N-acetylmuramic acid kinase